MKKKKEKPQLSVDNEGHPMMGEPHPVTREPTQKRVMFGIPMTGIIRSEWHWSQSALVTPTNWSQGMFAWGLPTYHPLGFPVADARNIIVDKAIKDGFDWLFFIDHDVLLPSDTLIKWNWRMLADELPVWGGLYFTKSYPAEPLVYKGRGNTFHNKFKIGDEVWCDGMGLGCHMIKVKLLEIMCADAEYYSPRPDIKVKRLFESPSYQKVDEEGKIIGNFKGTEDLPWYDKVMKGGYLKKAGYPKLHRKRYPFLCDTSVFCKHIDFSGIQYPAHGEEGDYK